MSLKSFFFAILIITTIIFAGFTILKEVRKPNDFYWIAFLLGLGFSGISAVVLLGALIRWFFYDSTKLFGYFLILFIFSGILLYVGSFAKYNRLF